MDTYYAKAPVGSRILAALLDGLIAAGLAVPGIIFYVIGMVRLSSLNGGGAAGMFVVAAFLYIIPVVYSFIKDGIGNGQSLGKKAFGLMVVHLPSNTPCTKGNSALRALISGLVSAIFIGWLIELILVLVTEDGQRLADKAASTQVIEANLFKN